MLPGLEIFHLAIANSLKSKNESIVALVHYILVSNGFRCVGLGEQFEENAKDLKGSELLPAKWNENDFYILRYVDMSKKNLLLLKIIPSDSILLVNVLLKSKDQIFATTVDPNKVVTNEYQKFDKMFASDDSLDNLVREIKREILDKFEERPKKQETADDTQPRNNPLLIEEPRRPHVFPMPAHQNIIPGPMQFPQIGRADLDPLGRGLGGGMMMDPRSLPDNFNNPLRIPQGSRAPRYDPSTGLEHPLPPGAVPPGARFEHFGPNIPPSRPSNRPNRPNPDQSGYDDMFM